MELDGATRAFEHDLWQVARNFAFSWHPEARALFARLDRELWESRDRNPVELLSQLSPDVLARAAADDGTRALAARLREAIDAESRPTQRIPVDPDVLVAYFSLEFGLDDALRVYSGGLGVLAGDHLKSSSELGVPLVGVGLLYRHGYFRQELATDGWQLESYPYSDPARLPLTLERDGDGNPVTVQVPLPGESLHAQVWRADVGSVPLYLLDADVDANSPDARLVTSTLYGGDRTLRIRQELLLGVGGVRALEQLGLAPTVFHMNEGHAAFLALERLRTFVARETPLRDALAIVRASTVFTTHTPVPAGNEVFDPDLVRTYLGPLASSCGLDWEELRSWGAVGDHDPLFGLTPLALRTASRANGVSRLHGEVSRRMWAPLYAGVDGEPPIGHVTNGVHARTWISGELQSLLEAQGVQLGEPPDAQAWDGAYRIPGADLWRVHRARKRALAERVAERARRFVDPEVLTLGFARRFATYKRGGLLISQPERLARLLADEERPVQIVFAGKAHPADDAGKDLIRRVIVAARAVRAAGRLIFVEDYDMELARHFVAGVDVWLNTPRRPQEASGTSGMKAGMNGVLNCSILDGWWPEAYRPEIGWAIGDGFESDDEATQDANDSDSLYRILEEQVVPTFYERDAASGLPERWLEMMRASIAVVGAGFNTHRMVADYVEGYYRPARADALAVAAATADAA